MTAQTVHGNCLVVGTRGILILGASGSGKSELTDTLIEAAWSKGNMGVLVADDRVVLSAENDQVQASAPEPIAGMMEIRGAGIETVNRLPVAKVHLLVNLRPFGSMDRLPEQVLTPEPVEGVQVPALICPENRPDVSLRLIRWGLRHLSSGSPDYI